MRIILQKASRPVPARRRTCHLPEEPGIVLQPRGKPLPVARLQRIEPHASSITPGRYPAVVVSGTAAFKWHIQPR